MLMIRGVWLRSCSQIASVKYCSRDRPIDRAMPEVIIAVQIQNVIANGHCLQSRHTHAPDACSGPGRAAVAAARRARCAPRCACARARGAARVSYGQHARATRGLLLFALLNTRVVTRAQCAMAQDAGVSESEKQLLAVGLSDRYPVSIRLVRADSTALSKHSRTHSPTNHCHRSMP